MADEAQPAAVATPAPAAKAPAETVVDQLRKALKPSKKEREAEIKTKAEARGANEVLKAAGVKKSERARVLEQLKEGKLKLADAAQESAEAKTKAAQAETDAASAKAELAALKAKSAKWEQFAKQELDKEFSALDEGAQKLVAKHAGDDLEKRLELIRDLKDNGLITKQEAAAATAQVKTEVKPAAPSTTAKAVNPKAPPPNATLTPRQQWEQMRSPIEGESQTEQIARQHLAARFYAQNANAIDRDWP